MTEYTQIVGLLYIIPALVGILMGVRDKGLLLIAGLNLAIGCVVFYLASTPLVMLGFTLGVAPLLCSGFILFMILGDYFMELKATRPKGVLHD